MEAEDIGLTPNALERILTSLIAAHASRGEHPKPEFLKQVALHWVAFVLDAITADAAEYALGASTCLDQEYEAAWRVVRAEGSR
jgi:hypothetical protein